MSYTTGYSKRPVRVVCKFCDHETPALYEEEYGAGWLTPEECERCKEPLETFGAMEDDGPDEDAAYDRWRDERDA